MIAGTGTEQPSLKNDKRPVLTIQSLLRPLRLCNALQCFHVYPFGIPRATRNIRTKHQAKVPDAVHLAEYLELLLMKLGMPLLCPLLLGINGFRVTPRLMRHVVEVEVLVYDDNIEGSRSCDGGEYGFEEVRCGGAFTTINRFRCGFERPEELVLRQIEILKQGSGVCYELFT